MLEARIGSAFCAAALLTSVACSHQGLVDPGRTRTERAEQEAEGAIFPQGRRAPAENYTGAVYGQPLAPKTEINNFSIGSVTFEPGARTHWHSHPAGQTLLVTDGKGLYQERGKPMRTLHRGDVILCDPDVEHWHGASPESRMSHIAITGYQGDAYIAWLGPVSDEEYESSGR